MDQVAPRSSKICNRCGTENPLNASVCKKCKCKRFTPPWVHAKCPINRQVSVEITESNAKYGTPTKRITLAKWWPGGSTSFHIPHASQWQQIEEIINTRLGPLLGWKTTAAILSDINAFKAKEKKNIKAAFEANPDILKKIVASVDPTSIGAKDFDTIMSILSEISDAMTGANAGFREAFLNVVKQLPHQKQRALEDLDLLLKGWSLQTITNVAQQVQTRLQTITLFEQQIQDARTFEIYGDNSIHRILERAMWLVDERYWLLLSNATLRKYIGAAMSKIDKKKYGKLRPDFCCGTVGDKLIILELKKPTHTLTVEDLNQLEKYLVIAEKYKNFSSSEGYLIGSNIDDELARTLKHRSSHFRILFYADIIDNTKQRYTEFLNSLKA